MKICVISTPVFPAPPTGYSGLEMIAYQCAAGLAARGHKVALAGPEGSHCPGGDVILTGPAGQWDEAKAFQHIAPHLPAFDVVIDHSWSKHAYMMKAQGHLKAPVLGVMHAPVDTMYRQLPPVEKPCMVAISRDQADHFAALFNRPVRVCYNGIDTEFYKPLNLPRTDRFLFLARFSSVKGADIAVEVCKRAGVGLDLVGDTSITNEPEYLARVMAMADGSQIRVHGGCSRGESVYWFSTCYAMLSPVKSFREPFGLAPVEAQACGAVCIAWNNGAMRETIAHPDLDLVTSVDAMVDRVRALVRNGITPETREVMRCKAKEFGLMQMVCRYEEACFEALETGGW